MPLDQLLWECFRHFYHLDQSNAAVHTAHVRYSPITFRLCEYIWEHFPSYRDNEILREVRHDLGAYEEDQGR